MFIDNKSAKNGSLLEDFSPSVNPEKEIDDPKDKKPEDWVEQARIPDPEATKPEDWDEDQPYEVVDTEAEKPDDWLEDEPSTIADPEAEKPEDWDDEEDGDWIPPQVPNPKCEEASGCGPWSPPMKKNDLYKGKWTAPYIDNPAYKGVWAPRKIANPDYFEDKTPANFEPIGAVSDFSADTCTALLICCSSASKSGLCNLTSPLTISTSVTPLKTPTSSVRRHTISSDRSRMPKRRRASPSLLRFHNRPLT
jgi:hypothetical protein